MEMDKYKWEAKKILLEHIFSRCIMVDILLSIKNTKHKFIITQNQIEDYPLVLG